VASMNSQHIEWLRAHLPDTEDPEELLVWVRANWVDFAAAVTENGTARQVPLTYFLQHAFPDGHWPGVLPFYIVRDGVPRGGSDLIPSDPQTAFDDLCEYLWGDSAEEWAIQALIELMDWEDGAAGGVEDYQLTELEPELVRAEGPREYYLFASDEAAEAYALDYIGGQIAENPQSFSDALIMQHLTVDDEGSLAEDFAAWVNDMDDDEVLESANAEPGDDPDVLRTQLFDEQRSHHEAELRDDPLGVARELGWNEFDPLPYWLTVDVDAAAQECIDTDGVAYYLAGYDHNEIGLPGGAVVYRQN
jgi:hypothetical protein